MNTSHHTQAPTAAWLEEWQNHREWQAGLAEDLASTDHAPPGLRLISSGTAARPSQRSAVCAGQIRVLHSLPVTGAQDPRPVLVLHESGERWCCAPFSPLTQPAHEGEWTTPLADKDARLSVLSLWDSSEIETALIETSRLIEQLETSSLEEAESLWAAWQLGSVLTESIREKTGTRLTSLLDPRYDYEEAVSGALQPWSEMRHFSLETATRSVSYSATADSTLALAASPESGQSLGHTYRLAGSELALSISLISPLEARLSLTNVTGHASQMLDGGCLLFADGSRLDFIGHEQRVPLERLGLGFAITDADGVLIPLRD